jgi:hypothetical protein
MKPRRQKDPARDAALTESFHAMLSRLKAPERPPDGVRGPLGIIGWVRVDVRLLRKRRSRASA